MHAERAPRRLLGIAHEIWHAVAQLDRRQNTWTDHASTTSRTVHHRGRTGRGESTTVEHVQQPAMNCVRPLPYNVSGRHRRRNPGSVRTRARNRLAVGREEALQPDVGRPAHGHATFRSAQSRRHALIPAAQHERQRTGPEARRQRGRIRRQVQVETGEVRRIVDEQQERFAGRAAFIRTSASTES